MMSNNKILTVSYGTFSCTLEGFDDSFGTMKAIAEYFRDLAADDRYFGAEPPQPDAEMLARIAEKEVSRRVEAREQDGKIVLSALEDDTVLVRAEKSPAPETAATTAAVLNADTTSADRDIIEENVEILTSPLEADATEPKNAFADVFEDEAPIAEVETLIAEGSSADALFVEDENDIVPGQPDADVEAFFASSPSAIDLTDDQALADVSPAVERDTPDPDSIAAKLQRIRAVVAQHEETDEDDDYSEDEHADANAPGTVADDSDALIADARAEIEGALEADDETADEVTDAQDEPADDEADDVDAILSRLEADAGAQEPPVEQIASADADDLPSVEDSVGALFEDDTKALEVSEPQIDQLDVAEEPAATEAEDTAEPRARVIKVKRADLEAAIEKGDLEEYGDDDQDTAQDAGPASDDVQPRGLDDLAPARNKKTALSAEDEADLAAELADLEDDIASGDADEEPRTATSLPSIDENSDTSVNRLLAETDHQMDEPESATRRDAFAHLRAAVASKKADVAAGASTVEEVKDDAYRDDLAQVVRPRRPVSNLGRTERPREARPAPLKLVAEQRIDLAKPSPEGPVRPRRISAQKEAAVQTPEGESFVEYASEMGATTLPQMLEAAAAYMSFVEGREQFSRPQLMSKVRQAGGEGGFSREESLRSFGKLLRSGKIEKIKAGRFTVSDDIGFRPDERAAS